MCSEVLDNVSLRAYTLMSDMPMPKRKTNLNKALAKEIMAKYPRRYALKEEIGRVLK
ncbi:hypothetical protein MCC01964_18650 [Bifidobacteriaceae bacterium MCC01964]|nr:hypothetical protein MCC01964_18650 [Bifidobacteriaceae bacterium MCC01964]